MTQIDVNKTFTNQEGIKLMNHAIPTQKQSKNILFMCYIIVNDVRKYKTLQLKNNYSDFILPPFKTFFLLVWGKLRIMRIDFQYFHFIFNFLISNSKLVALHSGVIKFYYRCYQYFP